MTCAACGNPNTRIDGIGEWTVHACIGCPAVPPPPLIAGVMLDVRAVVRQHGDALAAPVFDNSEETPR